MSPIKFEDQSQTLGPSAPDYQYRERFNLLVLLGLSDRRRQTNCRVKGAIPPEEENYSRLFIDLKQLGKH